MIYTKFACNLQIYRDNYLQQANFLKIFMQDLDTTRQKILSQFFWTLPHLNRVVLASSALSPISQR